ncbi:PAS domain-containing protein [Planctomycetales bacterium ZRK34]|nr:PAS domain-containing protein [Planctomycetales bacterium ZRK34]
MDDTSLNLILLGHLDLTWPTGILILVAAVLGGMVWIIVLHRQVREHRRMVDQLRESRDLLHLFVDYTPAAVAMFDRQMRYIAYSQRWIEDYNLSDEDLVGRTHYEVFPETPPRWKEIHQRCLAGEVDSCECDPFERVDGHTDYVRWMIHPWYNDPPGHVGGIIMFTEVITNRVETERTQKLMTQELDHRVKNNLSAVLSLAEQTAATTSDIGEFRQAFMGRIRAMAQAHEALAHAHWKDADLRTLASLTLAPYLQTDGSRLHLEGEKLTLPAKATMPICLALHELATNAGKHGALSQPNGIVVLRWSEAEDGGLKIEWCEEGCVGILRPERTGMGTRLLKGLIEYELQGRVEFDFRPSGLCCIISLS